MPLLLSLLPLVLQLLGLRTASAAAAPRFVRPDGRGFVLAATGEPIVMQGPNVVGPPAVQLSACLRSFRGPAQRAPASGVSRPSAGRAGAS